MRFSGRRRRWRFILFAVSRSWVMRLISSFCAEGEAALERRSSAHENRDESRRAVVTADSRNASPGPA